MKIKVMLRKDSGGVFAVFPESPSCVDSPTFMDCYMPIGGHAACSIESYKESHPAALAECKALIDDLYRYGYDFVIVKRISSRMQSVRYQNWKRHYPN